MLSYLTNSIENEITKWYLNSSILFCILPKIKMLDNKMAQRIKALDTKPNGLSSFSRIYIVERIDSSTLSSDLHTPTVHVHLHTDTDTYKVKIITCLLTDKFLTYVIE